MTIVFPDPRFIPTSTTRPEADAHTGVPTGAA